MHPTVTSAAISSVRPMTRAYTGCVRTARVVAEVPDRLEVEVVRYRQRLNTPMVPIGTRMNTMTQAMSGRAGSAAMIG